MTTVASKPDQSPMKSRAKRGQVITIDRFFISDWIISHHILLTGKSTSKENTCFIFHPFYFSQYREIVKCRSSAHSVSQSSFNRSPHLVGSAWYSNWVSSCLTLSKSPFFTNRSISPITRYFHRLVQPEMRS
jgi:hypothetical protein